MNFDGLLTTIVLLALVLIFGSILRRSANLRLYFWFIAWTLILIHCVVQWLGIPGFSETANEIVVIDTLVCAGTAFLCALCSIAQRRYLFLVAAAFTVPACAYCALVYSGVTSPWLLLSLILIAAAGVIGVNILAGERGKPLWQNIVASVLGVASIGAFVLSGQPVWGVMLMLGGIYLFNALLFYNHFPRLSTGVLTSLLGFLTWGSVFPVGFWLRLHYPAFNPPPVLWNLPKFFVAANSTIGVNAVSSGPRGWESSWTVMSPWQKLAAIAPARR
jgi:hypothetical protein